MSVIKISLKVLLAYLLSVSISVSSHESKLYVVTSFTILEDLVRNLGGDHVSIVNLVPRNSDAHIYSPKPSDSIAVANADLVIFNGLGFEGWITRLLEKNDTKTRHVVASEGINVLYSKGETDPHAWQSFKAIRIYTRNITQALSEMVPQHAGEFINNRNDYLHHLDELETYLRTQLDKIAVSDRVVVTSHDAFHYLGRELDIEFIAPIGLSLDAEASAQDVAIVIDQIRERNVKALFVENINNPKLLQMISDETGISIGGSLYSDALSEARGPAATYLNLMRHNVGSLVEAFKP